MTGRSWSAWQLLVQHRATLQSSAEQSSGLCWRWLKPALVAAAGTKAPSVISHLSLLSNPCQLPVRQWLTSDCCRLDRGKYSQNSLLGHSCYEPDGGRFNRLSEDKSCMQTYTRSFCIVCMSFHLLGSVHCQASEFSFSLGEGWGDSHPDGQVHVYVHWTSLLIGKLFTVKACRSLSVLSWTFLTSFAGGRMN